MFTFFDILQLFDRTDDSVLKDRAMAEKAAALPETQTMSQDTGHRPVPYGTGRARGLGVDAGLVGQRVVALSRHAPKPTEA